MNITERVALALVVMVGVMFVPNTNVNVINVKQMISDYIAAHFEEILDEAYAENPIDPDVTEILELLNTFGYEISVFYKNLGSGFTFSHNANRKYFGASIGKALLALYVYQLAEAGEVNLETRVTFTAADRNWGTGVIVRRYSVGTAFTVRELLRLNVSYSDNVATLMLIRHFGLDNYRRFVEEVGLNPRHVQNRPAVNTYMTAYEVGIIATAIFQYLESDGYYSNEFKNILLNNQFPFIHSEYSVASKTGWTDYRAWHEMAIVYAESPYILVIMTARAGWTAQDYYDFNAVNRAFQDFNQNHNF